MSIFEMCHQLPAMLSNRVFSVLVVTAKRGKDSFIVVQIPVDISNLTAVGSDSGPYPHCACLRSLYRLSTATVAT